MLSADLVVHPPATPGKVLMDDNDNYDVIYDPSPSSSYQTDLSTPGTSRCSTVSSGSLRYRRTYSEIWALSEPTESPSCSEEPSPQTQFWSAAAKLAQNRASLTRFEIGKRRIEEGDGDPEDPETLRLEIRLMKEKLSKLLLGEDMSGSGKGVASAVTVSNAITNLYATVFGQSLRLEPLATEKKSMWKREMNCLLSVCDYIVEFFPKSQHLQDGAVVEVMSSRPRSDIYINLPALQKLDTILLEILDSFKESEFWYAEEGSLGPGLTTLGSFRRLTKRKEDKWWLPVPCVPPGCLSEKSRKQLQHKRECANQIRKAAMAINSSTLAEMEIPEAYLASLSKTGRAGLGDEIYRYICTSGKFCPDYLLECLDITTEHKALELADRVEASMYTWKRKAHQSQSKSSWDVVRDFVSEGNKGDKNHLMAERADKLLFCLKQRYPELSQTTLDTCKIQYNRDMGQAILESYSRVLEGLAFNIVSWIEDVLYADKFAKSQQP